jgi:NADH-ubiquinone oxidoreductase chain 1
MTEHAAVIFVFFFLAEYASIVLMCIVTSILFFGGYLFDYTQLLYLIQGAESMEIDNSIISIVQEKNYNYIIEILTNPLIEGLIFGLTIGLKTCIFIFVFI